MQKEEKYISLHLAVKLQEVAKEKSFELPESEYVWFKDTENYKIERIITTKKMFRIFKELRENRKENTICRFIFAYDTAELGEMLPNGLNGNNKIQGTSIQIGKTRYNNWFCGFSVIEKDEINICFHNWNCYKKAKNEAEVRGEMLLYLIKNNLINSKNFTSKKI